MNNHKLYLRVSKNLAKLLKIKFFFTNSIKNFFHRNDYFHLPSQIIHKFACKIIL
jgi:hypothetical protein